MAQRSHKEHPGPNRRLTPARLGWLGLLVVVVVVVAVSGTKPTPRQSSARRISALEHELRCPSCADLSVADSTEPSALAIARYVRTQVHAGATNHAIVSYLETRYGQSILMVPSSSTGAGLLWDAPFAIGAVVLATGGWLAWRNARGRAGGGSGQQ